MARLLNREEAAEFVGVTKTFFSALVNRLNVGIPYVTLRSDGGRKYYRQEDLEKWLELQTKHKTQA